MAEKILELSSQSRVFVKLRMGAKVNGAAVDPSGYPVQLAVLPRGQDPKETDWQTADWEPDGARWWGRLLIGPGSNFGPLAKANYKVWGRVEALAERPVMESTMTLKVT